MSDILLLAGAFVLGACTCAGLLLPRLRSARSAASRAEAELATLARRHDDAKSRDAAVAAQNAALRRHMDELADAILASGSRDRPDPPGA